MTSDSSRPRSSSTDSGTDSSGTDDSGTDNSSSDPSDAAAHSDAAAPSDAAAINEPETQKQPELLSKSALDTVLDPEAVVESVSLSEQPKLRTVIGGRHEARERAVHLLYESQIKKQPVEDVLAAQVLAPDTYATELLRGVEQNREEIDEVISRLARGWTIERMATMDVVVLRVALFELLHRPDVPRGVVLAEAVDLAGQYGTDDSSKFVNGLLSAAADEIRPA
ncbi:MAG: transcription antitermination factor NusB [Microthrixaceae bacterium]